NGGSSYATAWTTLPNVADIPPSITSFTISPSGNPYGWPVTLTLSGTATDPDGSIAKVDFWSGPTLLGTSSSVSNPYIFTWNPTPGAYALTARATDNYGATGTSSSLS